MQYKIEGAVVDVDAQTVMKTGLNKGDIFIAVTQDKTHLCECERVLYAEFLSDRTLITKRLPDRVIDKTGKAYDACECHKVYDIF